MAILAMSITGILPVVFAGGMAKMAMLRMGKMPMSLIMPLFSSHTRIRAA